MIRLAIASALLLFGIAQSLRGPFYALLLYLGIAYFRPEMWVWTDSLRALNISFYVGIYTVLSTFLFRERIVFSLPVCLIIGFCFHSLIGTLLAPHVDYSMFWWSQYVRIAAVSVLIVWLVTTTERLRLAFLVIALALSFDGIKQGWGYLLTALDEPNLNPIEVLGDRNGVAVGMLMLSSVLLALLQTSTGWMRKSFFAFLLLGSVFRALTTYSRGGLLAFGTMCVIYLARSRYRIRTAVLLVILAVPLLALLPQSYWDRMDTMTTDSARMDFSSAGRVHFWRVAVLMANDHPFVGVGNTGFQAAYDQYDPTRGMYGKGRAVHSSWFGVLAEQGYVGLVLFVVIFLMALRACGKVRRATRGVAGQEQLFAFAAALQTALVTAAVGGSFLSYHYVEVMWHFIGFCFAIQRVYANEARQAPPVKPAQDVAAVSARAHTAA